MVPSQVGPDDDGDEEDRSNDPPTPGPGPDDDDEDDDEERDVGPDDDDEEDNKASRSFIVGHEQHLPLSAFGFGLPDKGQFSKGKKI